MPNKQCIRWARRYRSFAYKDVGEGREQDAEALPNLRLGKVYSMHGVIEKLLY